MGYNKRGNVFSTKSEMGRSMDYSKYETRDMKNKRVKEKIFDVALALMKQIGFDNITIRMICTEANISTGMFYKHFSSKEEILSFYYDKAQGDFDEMMNQRLAELPVREKLVRFYVWICAFTADLGVDFCRNFFNSKNERMNTNLFQNRLMDMTTRCMEDAMTEGFTLSPGRTPYQVSKDLCVIVKGIIFDWSAHEGSYSMPDFAEKLLTRCIDGLL